jgi:hypothetical protein
VSTTWQSGAVIFLRGQHPGLQDVEQHRDQLYGLPNRAYEGV